MTKTQIASLAYSHLGGRAFTDVDTDTTQQAIVCRKWFDAARDELLVSHPWNFAIRRKRLTTTWTALSGVALADNGSGEIRVTATSHGRSTGDRLHFKEVEGVTNANGFHFITVNDANTFDLDDSTYSGTHTSGTGSWVVAPQFNWDFQHALSGLTGTSLRVLKIGGQDGGHDDDGEDYQLEGDYILTDNEEPEVRYVYQHTTVASWPQMFITAFSYLLASYMATDLAGEQGKAMQLRQAYEQTFLPKARGQDARESKPRRALPFERSQLLQARMGGAFE
jgi:hypothetical protein